MEKTLIYLDTLTQTAHYLRRREQGKLHWIKVLKRKRKQSRQRRKRKIHHIDPKTGRTKERQKDIDKGFKKGGEGVGKAAKKLMMNSEFKKTAMKMAEAALADSMVDGSMAEEALNASREIVEKYYKKAFKAIDKAIADHKLATEDPESPAAKDVTLSLSKVFDKMTNTLETAMKAIQIEVVGESVRRMLDVEKAFPAAYARLNPGPANPAEPTVREAIHTTLKKSHEPPEESEKPPPFNPSFEEEVASNPATKGVNASGIDNVIDAVDSDGEDEKFSTSKKV